MVNHHHQRALFEPLQVDVVLFPQQHIYQMPILVQQDQELRRNAISLISGGREGRQAAQEPVEALQEEASTAAQEPRPDRAVVVLQQR